MAMRVISHTGPIPLFAQYNNAVPPAIRTQDGVVVSLYRAVNRYVEFRVLGQLRLCHSLAA